MFARNNQRTKMLHLLSCATLCAVMFYAPKAAAEPCLGFGNSMSALEQIVLQSQSQKTQQNNVQQNTPQSTGFPMVAATPYTPFVQQFNEPEAIKRWARNSAEGGGNIAQMEFGGRHLVFAMRSHIKPIQNTDMGVYEYRDGQWVLMKTFAPVKGNFTAANMYDDRIEFESEYGASVSLEMVQR